MNGYKTSKKKHHSDIQIKVNSNRGHLSVTAAVLGMQAIHEHFSGLIHRTDVFIYLSRTSKIKALRQSKLALLIGEWTKQEIIKRIIASVKHQPIQCAFDNILR